VDEDRRMSNTAQHAPLKPPSAPYLLPTSRKTYSRCPCEPVLRDRRSRQKP
jgi:hypothetical protein